MKFVIEVPENKFDLIQMSSDSGMGGFMGKIIADATPLEKVLEDIKGEINAIEIRGQVNGHTMFIRGGSEVKNMALEIIDNHISGKEKE